MENSSRNIILKQRSILHVAAVGCASVASDISTFHCFCYKAFYVSNFKDFNTSAPAC
jgi:hypothetical protein